MPPSDIVLQLVVGESERTEYAFCAGHEEAALTVGSAGKWSVVAPRVAPIHLVMKYDGISLFVRIHESFPAFLNGSPLGRTWLEVTTFANLSFGDARISISQRPSSRISRPAQDANVTCFDPADEAATALLPGLARSGVKALREPETDTVVDGDRIAELLRGGDGGSIEADLDLRETITLARSPVGDALAPVPMPFAPPPAPACAPVRAAPDGIERSNPAVTQTLAVVTPRMQAEAQARLRPQTPPMQAQVAARQTLALPPPLPQLDRAEAPRPPPIPRVLPAAGQPARAPTWQPIAADPRVGARTQVMSAARMPAQPMNAYAPPDHAAPVQMKPAPVPPPLPNATMAPRHEPPDSMPPSRIVPSVGEGALQQGAGVHPAAPMAAPLHAAASNVPRQTMALPPGTLPPNPLNYGASPIVPSMILQSTAPVALDPAPSSSTLAPVLARMKDAWRNTSRVSKATAMLILPAMVVVFFCFQIVPQSAALNSDIAPASTTTKSDPSAAPAASPASTASASTTARPSVSAIASASAAAPPAASVSPSAVAPSSPSSATASTTEANATGPSNAAAPATPTTKATTTNGSSAASANEAHKSDATSKHGDASTSRAAPAVGKTAERAALDTAAGGSFAAAADQYAALSLEHPENIAFREAARILRAKAAPGATASAR